MFKQPYRKAEHLVPMINIGAGLDIPMGSWYDGIHGEALLNGGMTMFNGFIGGGNMYKTAVLLYKMLMAMGRMADSTGSLYETEMNTTARRIEMLARHLGLFGDEDIIESERFVVTNREKYEGGEYYDTTKEWLDWKYTTAMKTKEMRRKLPFIKKGTTDELMEMIIPTFGAMDSFTDFVTKDAAKMNDEVSLGDKGAETLFMKQGLPKLRLLSELPPLLHKSAHYYCMSAQVGNNINMDQYNPEKKKLSNIVGNVKMKGVTDKFTYIMNSILQFHNLEKMLTKDKLPRFPRDEFDNAVGDTDLNLLHAVELRGKSGPSGVPIQLIVSQREGVKSSMTEFYNLLTHPDRFGLEGNDTNYNLALCPDVKLRRGNIRQRTEDTPALQRALTISLEMMQMARLMPEYRTAGLLCTPTDLFRDIKERGYDWDMILGGTRGWWTLNNDDHPVKFLSTLDLLRMRKDKYKPYWM